MEALKAKADAKGVTSAKRSDPAIAVERRGSKLRKVQLSTRDVASLLEGLGMAKEAAMLMHSAAEAAAAERHQPPSHRQEESSHPPGRAARSLLRALQALYLAKSASELGMVPVTETMDERALRSLVQGTKDFARALADLRGRAVDRELLGHFAERRLGEGIGIAAAAAPSSSRVVERGARLGSCKKRPSAAMVSESASLDLQVLPLMTNGASRPPMCKPSSLAESRSVGPGPGPPTPTLPPHRRRLRGKRPAIEEAVAVASSNGAKDKSREVQLAELRTWSVSKLKTEVLRLQPNFELRGALEKDDLCRAICELW